VGNGECERQKNKVGGGMDGINFNISFLWKVRVENSHSHNLYGKNFGEGKSIIY
jgi:hypothetical protein